MLRGSVGLDVAPLERDLKRAEAATRRSASEMTRSMDNAARAAVQAQERAARDRERAEREATRAITSAYRQAQRESEAASRAMVRAQEQAAQRVSAAWQAAGDVGGKMTIGLTLPIAAAGKTAFDAALRYDSLKASLTSVMGSAAAANTEFERLRQTSLTATGLRFETAVLGSVRLQSVGFNAREAEKGIITLNNAVIRGGGGSEQLKAVLYNLQQIASQGKLTGDELRETAAFLPDLSKVMMEVFKTTDTAAIAKMGVTGRGAVQLILEGLSRLDKAQDSARTNLMRLQDRADQAWAKIGAAILPPVAIIAEKLAPALETAADAFVKMGPEGQTAVLVVAGIAAAAGPLLSVAASAASLASSLKAISAVGGLGAIGVGGGGVALAGMGAVAAPVAGAVAGRGVWESVVPEGPWKMLGRSIPENAVALWDMATRRKQIRHTYADWFKGDKKAEAIGAGFGKTAATMADAAIPAVPARPFRAETAPAKAAEEAAKLSEALFSARVQRAQALLASAPEERRAQAEMERMLPLLQARAVEIRKEAVSLKSGTVEYAQADRDLWALEEQGQRLITAAGRERAENAKKAEGERKRAQEEWERGQKEQAKLAREAAEDARKRQGEAVKARIEARNAHAEALAQIVRTQVEAAPEGQRAAASLRLEVPRLRSIQSEMLANLQRLRPDQAEYHKQVKEYWAAQSDIQRIERDAASEQKEAVEKACSEAQKAARDAQALASGRTGLAEVQLEALQIGLGLPKAAATRMLLPVMAQEFQQRFRPVGGETPVDRLGRETEATRLGVSILQRAKEAGLNPRVVFGELQAMAQQAGAAGPVALATSGGASAPVNVNLNLGGLPPSYAVMLQEIARDPQALRMLEAVIGQVFAGWRRTR